MTFQFSEQLRAVFEPDLGAMWLRWNPKPRPCFNPQLLAACNEYCQLLQNGHGAIEQDGKTYPVESSILCSDVPGIFNLGGDLDLFTALIEERDRLGLMKYGMACVELVYRNFVGYDLPLVTVSLVQGDCLGGGFEAALSSQVVIAERGARFGFPEIMFNLFPGMGAVSFLLRRSNQRVTNELTSGGKVYTADEMLQSGIVDIVANDGEGPVAVREYLRKKGRAMRGLHQVRRRVSHLTRDELDDIVTLWANAALRLNPRDVKLMGHLVARQNRLT
ncbi:MAG: crotonase/enoyl-CoA hydratase family protein [Burkholderiales bacterium]